MNFASEAEKCSFSEAEKCSFSEKLSAVRNRLTPIRSPSVSNHELLLSLFGLAEKIPTSAASSQVHQYPSTSSFLKSFGQYEYFYCEVLT